MDVKAEAPLSLRHAFLRYAYNDKLLSKYELIEAESLNTFFPKREYSDLLQFEADLALISDLIILFSESFGSAAELGAFAIIKQISQKLLLVLDDKNYNENSFVKLGPVLSLENSHGDRSVCVLSCADIGIKNINNINGLNEKIFQEHLNSSIKTRIDSIQNHSTFDKNNQGHIIKFIVGIIQHYGALTLDEIEVYLYCFDIKIDRGRITQFLLVAEFVRWLKRIKRGINVYYSATSAKTAMSYRLKPEAGIIDKSRWLGDIQDKWKLEEPLRFASIQESIGIVL